MKKSLKLIAATIALSISVSGFASAQSAEFSDVSNHWAKEAIEWGVAQGAVNGYDDGTFKPDETISEAEFLSMFLRAFGAQIAKTEGNWSDPVYETAKSLNYPVLGETDNSIRNKPILRSQVAEIISGANGQNYTGDDAIRYLLEQGYTAGKTAATVEGYAGGDSLNRAEAIQFIKTLNSKGFTKLEARPEAPKTEKSTESTDFSKKVIETVKGVIADQPAYQAVEHDTSIDITKNGDRFATWVWHAFDGPWNEVGLSDAGNKDSIAFIVKMIQKGGIPVEDKFADVIAEVNNKYEDQTIEVGKYTIYVFAGAVKNEVAIVITDKE